MLYLHQSKILHLDLKPLNILISTDLHAKVSSRKALSIFLPFTSTVHRSTNWSKLPWRYDAEMGTANSLHASA